MARVGVGMETVPSPLASLRGCMVSLQYVLLSCPVDTQLHEGVRGVYEKVIAGLPCELQTMCGRVTKDTAGRESLREESQSASSLA